MMQLRGTALVLAGALAGCTAPPPAPRFAFQSSFWVNLHHFARAEARRLSLGMPLALPLEELDAEEGSAWTAGLAAYREFSQRSLIFDAELVAAGVAIAGAGEGDELPGGLVSPELTAALNRAAPVYRAHGWREQHRRNEQWIAEVEPLVAQHEEALVAGLAQAYRVSWPALPILVDVCEETGPFLAYTTCEAPPGFAGHTVVGPRESTRGPVAFECMAHEASHVVDAVLMRWVDEEAARQQVSSPEHLWHALLFFTAGVVAERILGTAGTYREDVAPAALEALEEHWRPYLEGILSLEQALQGLVRDVAAAEGLGGDPGSA